MQCPRDDTELLTTTVEDLELDSCPTCHGLWFDAGELAEASEKADPDVAWLEFDLWKHVDDFTLQPGAGACPRCANPLCRVEYGETGVEIEACPHCHGVWLDEDELVDVIHALEREVRERSVGELLVESLREALDIVRHPSHAARDWRDLRHILKLVRRRLFSENPRVVEMLVRAGRGNPLS